MILFFTVLSAILTVALFCLQRDVSLSPLAVYFGLLGVFLLIYISTLLNEIRHLLRKYECNECTSRDDHELE